MINLFFFLQQDGDKKEGGQSPKGKGRTKNIAEDRAEDREGTNWEEDECRCFRVSLTDLLGTIRKNRKQN
jgi:hypothetical protein